MSEEKTQGAPSTPAATPEGETPIYLNQAIDPRLYVDETRHGHYTYYRSPHPVIYFKSSLGASAFIKEYPWLVWTNK